MSSTSVGPPMGGFITLTRWGKLFALLVSSLNSRFSRASTFIQKRFCFATSTIGARIRDSGRDERCSRGSYRSSPIDMQCPFKDLICQCFGCCCKRWRRIPTGIKNLCFRFIGAFLSPPSPRHAACNESHRVERMSTRTVFLAIFSGKVLEAHHWLSSEALCAALKQTSFSASHLEHRIMDTMLEQRATILRNFLLLWMRIFHRSQRAMTERCFM